MSCCPPGSLGSCAESSSFQSSGRFVDYGGIRCYASGSESHATSLVVVFHDLFGIFSGRTRQICDSVAAQGCYVVMPDAFCGQYCSDAGLTSWNPIRRAGSFLRALRYIRKFRWRSGSCDGHPTNGAMEPLYGRVLSALAELPSFRDSVVPRRFMPLSFCWGSWAAYLTAAATAMGVPGFQGWSIVGGVHFHPSLRVLRLTKRGDDPTLPQSEAGLVDAAPPGPHIFVVCSNDPDNLRVTGGVGALVCGKGGQVVHVASIHGYMNRGEPSDPSIAADVQKGEELISTSLRTNF